MSMLAEPRSKQKWSQDPRNTNWSRDKTKFGYQMLTKMGWSEGKGLGQNLSGGVDHIKVNKRGSNAGIGLKKSHDDDWIAHQDDFNALLASLNQGSESTPGKMSSLENRVKSSKKKILYKRFIKSKDLSNASSHDLACIFGQRNNSAPVTPQESDNESELDASVQACPVIGNSDSATDISIKTVDSGVSIADYFAKKMASLKQKMVEAERTDQNGCEIDIVEECAPIEKKEMKKSKCSENGSDDNSGNTDQNSCGNEIVEDVIPIEKKKKKKKCKSTEIGSDNSGNTDQNSCGNDIVGEVPYIEKKKKKKKSKSTEIRSDDNSDSTDQNSCEDDVVEEIAPIEKKMKKKKSKCTEIGSDDNSKKRKHESNNVIIEDGHLKKKKRKRNRIILDDAEYQSVPNSQKPDPVKKSKKKKNKRHGSDDNET